MIKHNLEYQMSSQEKSKIINNKLNKELVEKLYKELGSIKSVAKKLEISSTSLQRYFKKNNIKIK